MLRSEQSCGGGAGTATSTPTLHPDALPPALPSLHMWSLPSPWYQEGYRADLLVVDGDPLQDISVLADPARRLKLIMQGGRVVKNAL